MTLRRRSREIVMPVTQVRRSSAIRSNNLAEIFEVVMFSHTQNENGTYNTRCLYCFMTVASSVASPEELDRVETQHTCPEKALADLFTERTVTDPLVHIH